MGIDNQDTVNAPEEIIETPPATEPVEAPAEEKPSENLRDVIKDAQKAIRARDESGKFTKEEQNKKKEAKPSQEKTAPESQAPVENKALSAPQSWNAAAKAKWATLPSDLQQEIMRREEEVHKGFTKFDEDRNYGKQLKEVITPYLPMIQAEGGNPVTAVRDLLNTAYMLRTGTPQQKGQLIAQVARQFGADLSVFNPSPQTNADPKLEAIQNELAEVKGYINQSTITRQQQDQAHIDGLIKAFSDDPKNVYFETVKADMAALLTGGRARDLQEAYDMAVWARPDIRSKLLEDQKAEQEAKRVAEAKQKAEAAKKAGSSVNGGPGVAVPITAAPNRSLRDEIRANLRASIN